MTYKLADLTKVDLDDFRVVELAEEAVPAESAALCCEYVFGYSVAAHEYEGETLVVITDNEEEGGGNQCRIITAEPAAYCAAFALALARDAAAKSAELFMSNSVVQHLYNELQASGAEATTVIYRDAKTYQVKHFGEFASRAEAEKAFDTASIKSLSVWYWASAQMTA